MQQDIALHISGCKAVMQVTCLTCPLIVQQVTFNYTVFCLVVLSYSSKCKAVPVLNTFTAIVDLSRFNNSCLKSPASTLVDLIFQSCALRSFSLNQLVTCHYRRETYTAASVYLANVIFIPFIVYYAYIAI